MRFRDLSKQELLEFFNILEDMRVKISKRDLKIDDNLLEWYFLHFSATIVGGVINKRPKGKSFGRIDALHYVKIIKDKLKEQGIGYEKLIDISLTNNVAYRTNFMIALAMITTLSSYEDSCVSLGGIANYNSLDTDVKYMKEVGFVILNSDLTKKLNDLLVSSEDPEINYNLKKKRYLYSFLQELNNYTQKVNR